MHRIDRLNFRLLWSALVALICKSWIQICRYYDRLGYLCIALLFNRWRDILGNFCQVNRNFIWFLGSPLVWLSWLLTAWWSWWHHWIILDYLFNRFSWTNILVNICSLDSCKTNYLHIFSSCYWRTSLSAFWLLLLQHFCSDSRWSSSTRINNTFLRHLSTSLFSLLFLNTIIFDHVCVFSTIHAQISVTWRNLLTFWSD